MLRQFNVDDIVRLLPPLSHRKALEDCASADGLLLFQAASCNHQIPAKAYEYLRLGKPVLALTPLEGDTAKLLEEVGGATIVDLGNEENIYETIPNFLNSLRSGTHSLPNTEFVSRYSRKYHASQLAECLTDAVSQH